VPLIIFANSYAVSNEKYTDPSIACVGFHAIWVKAPKQYETSLKCGWSILSQIIAWAAIISYSLSTITIIWTTQKKLGLKINFWSLIFMMITFVLVVSITFQGACSLYRKITQEANLTCFEELPLIVSLYLLALVPYIFFVFYSDCKACLDCKAFLGEGGILKQLFSPETKPDTLISNHD
jgi:hypothetical protein